jgi:hypothetical protein
MKKTLISLTLFLLTISCFAQDSETDSYTIQRLIVYNNDGEILLEKHKNGWMTPALRHNSKVTINESLEALASEFGLQISKPKLAGIFLFLSEYKTQASFRQHYVCSVVDGDFKIPEGKPDAKWFAPHKAIEIMSLPETKLIFAVRDMTKQVLDYPHIIWGGSFTLWKIDGKTQYKINENFYPISK